MTEKITHSPEATHQEIERKFLPIELPPLLERYSHEKIAQGYLANDANGAVRVRQKGDKFYITYKGIPQGHAAERMELETELSAEQFHTLWPGTEGRRVEKTRYKIPLAEHTIELDIFEGAHAGHVLAEVEFASTMEADAFVPPTWLGVDVTADKRFGNASIAEHGFPNSL